MPPPDPLNQLFIRRPDLVPVLLSGLGAKLPHYSVVRVATTDGGALPRSDVVLQLQWAPVLAIAVEVARQLDEAQRSRWPQLLAAIRQREQCAAELLIVTPEAPVATWAGQPLQVGDRRVTPRVLHLPVLMNEKQARKDHQRALLSAVAHASDPDEGRALRNAQIAQKAIFANVSDEDAGWYIGVIRESFPERLRDKLITPIVCPYDQKRSQVHFALGAADALLKRMAHRHGPLPPGVTEHVLTLSLEELARLRHRLAISQSLDEALAVPAESLAGKQGSTAELIEELALARQLRVRKRWWCNWPWRRSA